MNDDDDDPGYDQQLGCTNGNDNQFGLRSVHMSTVGVHWSTVVNA